MPLKRKQRKRKLHDILEQQLRPHEASTDAPHAGHDMLADAVEGANSDEGELSANALPADRIEEAQPEASSSDVEVHVSEVDLDEADNGKDVLDSDNLSDSELDEPLEVAHEGASGSAAASSSERPRAAPKLLAIPEGARGTLTKFRFHNGMELRYKWQDQSLTAHCTQHKLCRKTRSMKAGKRAGQGRPLGFLVAWLFGSEDEIGCSAAQHESFTPTFDQAISRRESGKHSQTFPAFSELQRACVILALVNFGICLFLLVQKDQMYVCWRTLGQREVYGMKSSMKS